MTHYTLEISFCITTIERFGKVIQVHKFVDKVAYIILITQFFVTEIAQWLET